MTRVRSILLCIIRIGDKSKTDWNEIAIIMPDDVAEEKVKALHALGADVLRVRPASIVDKKQVCPFLFLRFVPPRH